MNLLRPLLFAFVAIHFASVALAQTIVFVDDDAPGGGDGTSWARAYNDLQTALAATSSGEVWVAAGIYTPGPPGDETSSFALKSGVALYGGFAGNESTRQQRDWLTHESILSGDVGRDDIYGSGEWNIVTGNSEHVVIADGVNGTAILDGFVVEAGHSGHANGAGLFVPAGTPTVRNCRFDHNVAGFTGGGGAYVANGRVDFDTCAFVGNWCHLMEGGAIYIGAGGVVHAIDCTFTSNTSTGAGRQAAGGAVSNWGVEFHAIRCDFIGNVARGFYAANDVGGYAGAVHHFSGSMVLDSCTFTQNWSNAGGAVWAWNEATIVNCLFRGNQAPQYSHYQGDWGGEAGAIGGYSFQAHTLVVVNTTIVDNSARKGGGLVVGNAMAADVDNCILWGNTDRAGTVGPSQIRGAGASYSCIQNMLEGEQGEDPPDPDDFPHSISSDPALVNRTQGDLHLLPTSPCIDAADNASIPDGVTTDRDGQPRRVEDPDVPDTGNGPAPIVDMGAFERQVDHSSPANLINLSIITGSIISGGLPELNASDDLSLQTRSGFGSTFIDLHNMEAVVSAVTTVNAPATLDLTVEARLNQPAGSGILRLRNWSTNQFVQVGQIALNQTDVVHTVNGLDATNYVNAAGEIDLSIKHRVFIPIFAFRFDSFIDHVGIVVNE